MPVIIQPCIKLNIALHAYNPSTIKSIFPIYPKSIPPVPAIFLMSPSERPVVALPSILGPITLNTVEAAAITITNIIAILYVPIYFISFPIEPLKSLAFSAGIIPLPGPPGPRLLGGCLYELLSAIIMLPPFHQIYYVRFFQ